jgi:tetratricopeptide (TPR) repeat protein
MSKKLSKEDLEQDLLIEYSSRFLHFYQTNKAVVWGGGIGLVLLIGLIVGFFIHSAQQESQAQELLGTAEQFLAQGNIERALHGDEDALTLGFIQIANNYGRTSAGNLAHYYAAVSEFELNNYEAALNHIESFRVPDGIIGVSPLSLHANILLELERYEDAAKKFEKAAKWDENSSTTPVNLFAAAEAYAEAGMNREAINHLDTILSEYSSSPVANRAQRMRGMLRSQS